MTVASIFSRPDTRRRWLSEGVALDRMAVLTAVIGPDGLSTYRASSDEVVVSGRRGDAHIRCYPSVLGYVIEATTEINGAVRILTTQPVRDPYDTEGVYRAQQALEEAGVRL